jgi:aspartate/methionine/tyrosine aminotransferase
MTFVPAERLRNVRKSAIRRIYDQALPGSINLGLGELDLAIPDVVRREAVRVIEEERNGYTSNAGLPSLREKIAGYHSESSTRTFSPESVCVTNGVEEALFAVMTAVAGPGDEVLVPDPGFLAYPALASIAGASLTSYKLPAGRAFGLDRDSFKRGLTQRTKLVFVNSPSNPTGQILTRDDLEFMSASLAGTNAYVVSDEIYRELYFGEPPGSIVDHYENTIIVSGMSKMMSMTGWRVGWAIGPEELIAHVTVAHQYISTCASTVSQKAATAGFTDEGRQAIRSIRDELRHRRSVMAAALAQVLDLPFVLGEGAFYAMLDISRFGASEDVAAGLLSERVITAPGSAFGPNGEGYLRLSFSIEPESISDGVRRIAKGLGLS